MATPMSDSIRNPLAEVTACPACGQIIAGLPSQGRWPECGAGYDRHEVVLFGSRRWHVWGLWGEVLTAAPVFWFTLGSRDKLEIFASAVWGLTLVGLVAAAINRLLVERPGQARLRLSQAGCGLDVETPPPPVPLRLLILIRNAAGLRRRWWTAEPWVRSATLPWYQVRRTTITPARDGRWRIQVQRSGYTRGRAVPIDVTVSATAEQLDALRSFVAEFTQLIQR